VVVFYEPFARGLYAEAGAMRIPRAHPLTLAYVDKFGLPTSDFIMGNPQTYVHVGGVPGEWLEVVTNPNFRFKTMPVVGRPQ
jgi:monoamine oxidase